MTTWEAAASTVMAAVLVRQLFVLHAVARSARFLRRPCPRVGAGPGGVEPVFFVVLPVLREAAVITDAVTHFQDLVQGHTAQLVVVTTQREAVDPHITNSGADTVALVQHLASQGKLVHLHQPDPAGVKGDQLNFAAQYCAATLLGDVPADRAFLICYDVDSRPPRDSLDHFADAAATFSDTCVFHQSSRFELRTSPTGASGSRSWLSRALGEGAALRANRFVLGFEIPRLVNRSAAAGRVKRWLCSAVYAHITGHGLGIRLSLLLDLPLPRRSPLEDMHYSFHLGSRDLPMVPLTSLDRAEVPATIAGQVSQAARWFFGPARCLRYRRDPATRPGWRANLMAASALGSTLEWLGCAFVPLATVLLMVFAHGPARWLSVAVAATYGVQLLATDRSLGSPAFWPRRALRMVACPVAAALFGVGGWIGLVQLLAGGYGAGKTER